MSKLHITFKAESRLHSGHNYNGTEWERIKEVVVSRKTTGLEVICSHRHNSPSTSTINCHAGAFSIQTLFLLAQAVVQSIWNPVVSLDYKSMAIVQFSSLSFGWKPRFILKTPSTFQIQLDEERDCAWCSSWPA